MCSYKHTHNSAVHTKDYDEVEGRIHVIHATDYYNKYKKKQVSGVVEESYKKSYYAGKNAKFYTPVEDKPDDLTDGDVSEFKVGSTNQPNSFLSKYNEIKGEIEAYEELIDFYESIDTDNSIIKEGIKELQGKINNLIDNFLDSESAVKESNSKPNN